MTFLVEYIGIEGGIFLTRLLALGDWWRVALKMLILLKD